MAQLIGNSLETVLNGMPGLEFLRSTSVTGLNDIKCDFACGTDYWAAHQKVINRIGPIQLPGGETPALSPWNPTGEIVRYVWEGPGYSLNQIKAVQDWNLTRALKQAPGVVAATSFGGTVKQSQVLLGARLLKQQFGVGVSMGIVTTKVSPQTLPIRLELLGNTEAVSDTLSRIRFMFKGRVDTVEKRLSETGKIGDPLIHLDSTELAEAKSGCEIKRIQWRYDKNLLDVREPLVKGRSISQQLFAETQKHEMKSRRDCEVARDKLLVYGLSETEVGAVKDQTGSTKSRMTIRSPADGIVISRDVVVGNLYDENDILPVIAPPDPLWGWGNVFESELSLVRLESSCEVYFPFLNHTIQGKAEYNANRVGSGARAIRVRTSVPNPEGRLKADMLVRGKLEIPLPRRDRDSDAGPGRGRSPGLGLPLAQLYDDLKTMEAGTPIRPQPRSDES